MTLKGIDDNYFKDMGAGILIFVGYLLVQFIFPGLSAITVPSFAQSIASNTGRFIVVVVLASIVESALFFGLMLDFFDEKLKVWKLDPPFFVASIITAVGFSLFHFVAYGGNLASASGSFLSAFLIGMVWCYSVKWSNSILPAIISHSAINFWIIKGTLVLLG